MAVDAGTIFSEVRIALDKLTGDVKSVNTKMDQIVKKSDEVAKKSQGPFKKFFSFIKKSGVASFLALGIAIAKVSKFLKESEAAARDAQEVYSKFNTVFESIEKSANIAADAFAESFGLAGSTARELLGATGDLLVGMGATEEQALSLSTEVNTLAADLASFSNIQGGTQRASQALTKALLGERESAKLLGVVIRETDVIQKLAERGQENLTGQALLLAKAQVTLTIATEQSQKALGDYARTMDSAANVQKRMLESNKSLKEQVGTSFSQIVTAVRIKIIEWSDALAEVLKNQNAIVELTEKEEEGNATIAERIKLLELQIEAEQKRIKIAEESGRVNETQLERSRTIAANNIRNAEKQIELLGKLGQIEAVREQAIIENNAKEKAAADAKEEILLAQIADTQFRIKVEKELQDELFAIDQQLKLSIETGQEFNAELEKQKAVQSSLNQLFAEQFSITGPGVQGLIDKYGEYLETTTDVRDIFGQLAEMRKEWEEGELDRIAKVDAKEEEAAKKRQDELQDRIDLTFTYVGLVMSVLNSLRDLQNANNQEELTELEENLNAQLDAAEEAGASDEELADIREANAQELADKKKALSIEEAKRNKALALLNIAINTASAVIAALVAVPPNVALSVAIGATGAVQAALVAAQPIPSFQTGGIVLPRPGGQLVNVAENGSPELMLNSGASGQALLSEFADQISNKMGGGMTLIIQAGDEIILQQKIDSWYENNEVLVDVSTQLTGVK